MSVTLAVRGDSTVLKLLKPTRVVGGTLERGAERTPTDRWFVVHRRSRPSPPPSPIPAHLSKYQLRTLYLP